MLAFVWSACCKAGTGVNAAYAPTWVEEEPGPHSPFGKRIEDLLVARRSGTARKQGEIGAQACGRGGGRACTRLKAIGYQIIWRGGPKVCQPGLPWGEGSESARLTGRRYCEQPLTSARELCQTPLEVP